MSNTNQFCCRHRVVSCCLAIGMVVTLGHHVQAVVLNDDYFIRSGGDIGDVAGTLDMGYTMASAYIIEDQFLSVGNLGGFCTATWLGNTDDGKSFVLTAAHCVESAGNGGSISTDFLDWQGQRTNVSGTVHLPPERYNSEKFGCGGGACSDIAVLEFDNPVNIVNSVGEALTPPMIYDGQREQGFENSFVGYGSWGIGSLGSDGGLFPSSGHRRAGATNVIDGFFESNRGIGTSHDLPGTGNFQPEESGVASGDSGSAWWQQHLGHWSIIATTNGGSGAGYGGSSTGARVSQYADWIEGIYPDVERWSEIVLIGDINLDGQITTSLDGTDDYSAFIEDWRNYSGPGDLTVADLNEDHIVDFRDFAIFREAVIASGGVIPEPDSATIVLYFAVFGTVFRRKRLATGCRVLDENRL